MTLEKQSDLMSRLLAAAKHLKVCDRQSNYIKVQCDQCEEAHSIIAEAENFIGVGSSMDAEIAALRACRDACKSICVQQHGDLRGRTLADYMASIARAALAKVRGAK